MKHNILNPIGKEPDISICNSIGHNWDTLFVYDREFRNCKRCDRQERKEYFGSISMWVVNEIKPSVA